MSIIPFIHPTRGPLRLGKGEVKDDPRGKRYGALMSGAPGGLPPSYNFDTAHPGCTDGLYGNDRYGDCTCVAAANFQQRMELIQQGIVIPIQPAEVTAEYFNLTVGPDSGLSLLTVLDAWKKGFTLAGKLYSIADYAQIVQTNMQHIQQSIYLLGGCYIGLQLPVSAQKQVGQLWTLTGDPIKDAPGSWGGHCVYLKAFDTTVTPTRYGCATWGADQWMDEVWLLEMIDEAWGVIDAADSWLVAPADVMAEETNLNEVKG